MAQPSFITKLFSYLLPIQIRKYKSSYSGDLLISIENGQKVLNTASVNYSFNSLHRVFKSAFQRTNLGSLSIHRTLLLGLGGGSILQILRNDHLVKTPIDIVEIDPVIIQIAIDEFDINQYQPIEIIEADAQNYVPSSQNSYSLICVDLFINEHVPSQFLTTSFMDELIQLTQKNGRIYFNIMLSSHSIIEQFNNICEYLNSKKNIDIATINILQMEENNRVLVIEK